MKLQSFKNTINLIFGFAMLIGACIGLFYLIKYIYNVLQILPKEIGTALVAGIFTVTVTIISVYTTKYFERKKIIEQTLRDKKCPVYEEFVQFILKIIIKKDDVTQDEMLNFIINFTQKIIIWGSDDVLQKWQVFRNTTINLSNVQDQSPLHTQLNMVALENLLFAIRKDIGYKNNNIKQGDILRLFITDIDNYLPIIKD